jgi:16S rRNA (guanine527-N7)-methyltransferase
MDQNRIATLLAPFLVGECGAPKMEGVPVREAAVLTTEQLQYISMYIDLLLRWNVRISLTAIRKPDEIVTRHFGESIFTARCLFPRPTQTSAGFNRVIDFGSGAGFPGLPIKIWSPGIDLTLIESNQKKSTFLREAVRSLGMNNVEVFNGRAEAFTGDKANVVTFRAVERFGVSLPIAAEMVTTVGRLAVLIGTAQVSQLKELTPSLKWDEPIIFPLSANRSLVIGQRHQYGGKWDA